MKSTGNYFPLDLLVVSLTLASCPKSPISSKPGHSGAPEGLAASNPLPPISPSHSGEIQPKDKKENFWHYAIQHVL
jgi:hypothetical protein